MFFKLKPQPSNHFFKRKSQLCWTENYQSKSALSVVSQYESGSRLLACCQICLEWKMNKWTMKNNSCLSHGRLYSIMARLLYSTNYHIYYSSFLSAFHLITYSLNSFRSLRSDYSTATGPSRVGGYLILTESSFETLTKHFYQIKSQICLPFGLLSHREDLRLSRYSFTTPRH